MPREAAEWFAKQVSQSLIDATEPTFEGRRVCLIDGTTITLAPEPKLRAALPPASNQHGRAVFPVALLTVAHELASGAALIPQVGAKSGENAVSETALIHNLLRLMPAGSVAMADSEKPIGKHPSPRLSKKENRNHRREPTKKTKQVRLGFQPPFCVTSE